MLTLTQQSFLLLLHLDKHTGLLLWSSHRKHDIFHWDLHNIRQETQIQQIRETLSSTVIYSSFLTLFCVCNYSSANMRQQLTVLWFHHRASLTRPVWKNKITLGCNLEKQVGRTDPRAVRRPAVCRWRQHVRTLRHLRRSWPTLCCLNLKHFTTL